ncbi:tryptophan transporter [Bacillus sp. M6-12]|uniref:tryptophan transporter n=1 Tax=Bacillus sp. M6-12 TaxID=2054166 RepID=UPI000C77E52B|nr:tryptophan transporter [Bacillus sp. M6-12]PLS15069.1 tryptophan transporter [Bacillus sp. M6-12]
MKTRDLVFMSLLMGLGFVLHAVIPGFFFGMKPDIFLVMMFVGILAFPSIKHVFLLGSVAGLLSAFTTTFPAGQIPNIVDKGITALVFFILVLTMKKYKDKPFVTLAFTFVGTIVSGSIFLGSALLMSELPAPFIALFSAVVLPTAVVNSLVMGVIYPIVLRINKQTNKS